MLECVQPDVECMTLTQPSFLSFYYLCIFILTAAAVNLSTKLRSSFLTSHSPHLFGGVIGSHGRFSEGFILGLTGLMVLPPFIAALILCAIAVTVCPAVHSERVLNSHTDENDKGRLHQVTRLRLNVKKRVTIRVPLIIQIKCLCSEDIVLV